MTPVFIALASALLLWALFSARLASSVLTPPMFFTGVGLLLAAGGPMHEGLEAQEDWVHLLAEITLVLVLFTDASRIDLRTLWREHDLPGRLLGIGLPLTILLGTVVAWLLLPSLGGWGALLLAAILAPTDAALGQAVVTDAGVPVRIRQTLNVESGLNDGLALPVVLVALCAVGVAQPEAGGGARWWAEFAALQVLLGPLSGVVVGWLGGKLVDRSARAGRMTDEFEALSVLALAVLAFAGAEQIGGNGFIAAFVAGMTLGNTVRERCRSLLVFGETEGQLLTLLTFAAFGALVAPLAWRHFDAAVIGYAVLSLTVIRGLPVALALRGKGLGRASVGFLAWFGPRGIASILFVLVVVRESNSRIVERLTGVVATTVLLSVVAHGLSAAPLAAWYARVTRRDTTSGCPENVEVVELPLRHGHVAKSRPADPPASP